MSRNLKVAVRKSHHFLFNTAPTTLASEYLLLSGSSIAAACIDFAQVMDCYRYWRMTSLRVRGRYVNSGATLAEFAALAFTPVLASVPTVLSDLDGLPWARGWCRSSLTTVPHEGEDIDLRLTTKDFGAAVNWLESHADSTIAEFDQYGTLTLLLSPDPTSGDFFGEVWMNIEYAVPLDPSSIAIGAEQRMMKKLAQKSTVELLAMVCDAKKGSDSPQGKDGNHDKK